MMLGWKGWNDVDRYAALVGQQGLSTLVEMSMLHLAVQVPVSGTGWKGVYVGCRTHEQS